MEEDWYIIAKKETGTVLRIVSGPLSQAEAKAETKLRRRKIPSLKFSIIKFDPLYGLSGDQ